MIKIEIDTDNAAFKDDGCTEVARILREFADKIDGRELPKSQETFGLYDINGNSVGSASLLRESDK